MVDRVRAWGARSTVDRSWCAAAEGWPGHGGAMAVVAVLAATARLGTRGRAEGTNVLRAVRRV